LSQYVELAILRQQLDLHPGRASEQSRASRGRSKRVSEVVRAQVAVRRTTITSVKLVPDGYDVDPQTELIVAANKQDRSALDMLSFATLAS
jgi:hypothetical protein